MVTFNSIWPHNVAFKKLLLLHTINRWY